MKPPFEIIDGGAGQRRESAIAILEHALEEARRGEIAAVFMVLDGANGKMSTRWSGFLDVAQKIGRMRILEHDILDA